MSGITLGRDERLRCTDIPVNALMVPTGDLSNEFWDHFSAKVGDVGICSYLVNDRRRQHVYSRIGSLTRWVSAFLEKGLQRAV